MKLKSEDLFIASEDAPFIPQASPITYPGDPADVEKGQVIDVDEPDVVETKQSSGTGSASAADPVKSYAEVVVAKPPVPPPPASVAGSSGGSASSVLPPVPPPPASVAGSGGEQGVVLPKVTRRRVKGKTAAP